MSVCIVTGRVEVYVGERFLEKVSRITVKSKTVWICDG